MLSGRRILDLMKLLTIQNEENMTSAVARIRRSLRGCKLRLSLGITLFEETGYCLDFLGFLIALPFLDRWVYHPVEILDRWGFYYADNALVFNWKNKYKFIHMPWDWDHCGDKHMVQLEDGSWEPCRESWEPGGQDSRFIQTFPYTYTLKNGTVQSVTATVHVERREWRRKCFWRIPWFAKKRQEIDVTFSNEVGERSGSFKGGCIGCGYDMLPGETAEQTLRRMERERKFN